MEPKIKIELTKVEAECTRNYLHSTLGALKDAMKNPDLMKEVGEHAAASMVGVTMVRNTLTKINSALDQHYEGV